MNQQRNKILDELKTKHLKHVSSGSNPVSIVPSSVPVLGQQVVSCPVPQSVPNSGNVPNQQANSSPFILSSGPVTGTSGPAPILPNQTSTSTAFSNQQMEITPSQKALQNAHNCSFGIYVAQDSNHNPIMPVLPRYP